jgi:Protein of unknown function (DUF4239)
VGWFLRLLQGVPVWLAGVILTAVGLAATQLCLLLVGRLVGAARRRRSNELIAHVLSVAATIYAIPLALIAAEAWSDFTEARAAAAREAGEVARTALVASMLPPELARAVRAALTGYATAVIEQDWPVMTQGGRPRGGEQVLTELRLQLAGGTGGAGAAGDVIDRVLAQLDSLIEAREARILAIDEGLIGAVWWLIGVGGTITLLLSAAYAADDVAMHRVLCGLLSLAIMSVVLLIVATDRPFHGEPRVPPDAMREVLETELRPGP